MTWLVNSSTQAIRMRSAVAGLSNGNGASKPASLRAAAMASLMEKKTVVASPSGGSPIAYKAVWLLFVMFYKRERKSNNK